MLIWWMIYPMMLALDIGSITQRPHRTRGLIVSVVVNRLMTPSR